MAAIHLICHSSVQSVHSSLLSVNFGVFLSFIFLSLENVLFMPSSPLVYYVFFYTDVRA